MFKLRDLVQPVTLEQAFELLTSKKSNTVLGGCAFLKLGGKRITTAIDISKLGLDFINDQPELIEIGAMATLRDLEISRVLMEYFNGVIPQAVGNVVGVQFRNTVTAGGSVFSKYGFSDLLTALLALDTEVELYKGGHMSLTGFLDRPYEKDILTKIMIKKNARQAAYQSLRNSAADYPVLNVAVSCLDGHWLIAVGARPLKAKLARQAAGILTGNELSRENIELAARTAARELSFGTNARGTAEYRRALCEVLVKRAVAEVGKQC